MIKVVVPKEIRAGEARVAAIPELVAVLLKLGVAVAVQTGAGAKSHIDDAEYVAAGASIIEKDGLAGADVVLCVSPLTLEQGKSLPKGAVVLGLLAPAANLGSIRVFKEGGVTSFALELIPRISRAQSMDALTSQALVAGYRAGLKAAELLPRFFPLLMTAAGTMPPARVVVLGAGVAGLQAIATARRLGAIVDAYDVRPSSAEEIRSVGANAIDLKLESLEGTGGYAREMTQDRAALQRELLTPYIAAADAVITTAAIPGRAAPLLVTAAMVETMRPGSVVVDLAAESGGNCELSVPGQTVHHHGVSIWGGADVPSQMPMHASRLYARNLANFFALMVKDSALHLDFDDEVLAASVVTHEGKVMHVPTRELIEAGVKPSGGGTIPSPEGPATKTKRAKKASVEGSGA